MLRDSHQAVDAFPANKSHADAMQFQSFAVILTEQVIIFVLPSADYSTPGRVVDATDSVVRLELEAQNRTVTVSRSSLKFTVSGGGRGGGRGPGGRGGGRGGPGFGGRGGPGGGMGYPDPNPFHGSGGGGSQTPSRGSRTPAYGGATPAHPSMTPTHGGTTPRRGEGGRTPMRDSAWNPMSGTTPLHPGTSSGAARTPAEDPYASKHDQLT
eukprot:scaffold445393_cov32-Prasinocladus_malaysianus.AAC.1